MATSHGPQSTSAPSASGPLRLRLTPVGDQVLDGGWWPRSRDLAVELADLIAHFPSTGGVVSGAVHAPGDWDPGPTQVALAVGHLDVATFLLGETNLLLLTITGRRDLRLLVVPADLSAEQGAEALLAAATSGNRHTAEEVLDAVTDAWPTNPHKTWGIDPGR